MIENFSKALVGCVFYLVSKCINYCVILNTVYPPPLSTFLLSCSVLPYSSFSSSSLLFLLLSFISFSLYFLLFSNSLKLCNPLKIVWTKILQILKTFPTNARIKPFTPKVVIQILLTHSRTNV